MKKIVVLIAVVVLVGGIVLWIRGSSDPIEKETLPIAVEAVVAISESWNAQALKDRADPGLINAMSSQGQSAEELLRIYSALGTLNQPVDCKVKTTGSFMKHEVRNTTITFECAGDYEKGPAIVSLTLSKAENAGKWLIYYINIRSDVFEEIIE